MKAQKKPKPVQPPALTRGYAYDSVKAQARAMRWDERQEQAAEKFHVNYAILGSPGTGSLDLDRVSGGGSPGRPPALYKLEAGEVINQALRELGTHRLGLLVLVLHNGMTLREATQIHDPHASRGDIRATGEIISDALTQLADLWSIGARSTGVIRSTGFRAESQADLPRRYQIETGGAYHAGYRKVGA